MARQMPFVAVPARVRLRLSARVAVLPGGVSAGRDSLFPGLPGEFAHAPGFPSPLILIADAKKIHAPIVPYGL